jgi:WD40 repeat protein
VPVNNAIARLQELPAKTSRDEIWAIDFSKDGSRIAIGNNFQVDVWDWKDKYLATTIPLPRGVAPRFDANAVQYSPDGTLLAILVSGAAQRLVVRVLNTKDWTVVKDIKDEQSARVVGLAFTPDGKFLLTANDMIGRDGDSLTLYATNTWAAVWGLNLGFFRPLAIAVSPNGKSVAIGGQLTIAPPREAKAVMDRIRQTKQKLQTLIIDLSTRSIVRSIDCDAFGQMAWSSDSNRLAVVGGSAFAIYDANTGASILRASEPGIGHQNVRFTPDGQFFINSDSNTSGMDRGLQVWNAIRQRLLANVRGNISSIAVSSDASLLAAGETGHVIIWRLKPSKE